MWCVPGGRSDRGAVSLMCWGWAFCTRAPGVHLVSLKALTSPALHLHLHSSAEPLRCCGPHSTITLPLLNIYGSQETRSQQQLFYSHTFLIASAQAFTTLSFMPSLGESETSSKFLLLMTQEWPCGFTGKATVPSCGHDLSLQHSDFFIVIEIIAQKSSRSYLWTVLNDCNKWIS